MESDLLYQDRQQLQALLEQSGHVATQLPRLKAGNTTGWVDQLIQWSQGCLSTIRDWLEGVVGPFPRASMPIDWDNWSPMLFWAAVGLLVICLARVLLVYCRSRGGRRHPGGAHLPSYTTRAAEGLSTRLATAVQQERWGLATRLRWRLFLFHMDLRTNTTPYEFFRNPACPDQDAPDQPIPIREQYRIMFTETDASRQWFDAYQGRLDELEREHRDG